MNKSYQSSFIERRVKIICIIIEGTNIVGTFIGGFNNGRMEAIFSHVYRSKLTCLTKYDGFSKYHLPQVAIPSYSPRISI